MKWSEIRVKNILGVLSGKGNITVLSCGKADDKGRYIFFFTFKVRNKSSTYLFIPENFHQRMQPCSVTWPILPGQMKGWSKTLKQKYHHILQNKLTSFFPFFQSDFVYRNTTRTSNKGGEHNIFHTPFTLRKIIPNNNFGLGLRVQPEC